MIRKETAVSPLSMPSAGLHITSSAGSVFTPFYYKAFLHLLFLHPWKRSLYVSQIDLIHMFPLETTVSGAIASVIGNK